MAILTNYSDPERLWGDELLVVTSLTATLPEKILATVPANITIVGKNVAGLNVTLDSGEITCTGATLSITSSDENGAVGTVTFAEDGNKTLTIGYGDATLEQTVVVAPNVVTSLTAAMPPQLAIIATEPHPITIIGKNELGQNLVLDTSQVTCTGATLSFTSSDTDGAIGTITFATEGSASYTIAYGSASVTQTATVLPVPIRGIAFNSDTYTLSGTEGDTMTEAFTVTADRGDNVTGECTYTLSPNDTGLTCVNGTLDASNVTAGTYTVTVTATYDGLTTTATVSMTVASAVVDYSTRYLTFEALESGTFTLTVPAAITSSEMTSVSYSTDGGTTWTDTAIDSTAQTITTPTIAQGGKVLWKGTGTKLGSTFSATGRFNAEGNAMSLLYGDNFAGITPLSAESALYRLFMNNANIVSAGNMVLPATTLTKYCYQQMFNRCTSLTTAPALPATKVIANCYYGMFQDCTSLTTAPSLPATEFNTTLGTARADNCYSNMFSGCTSLTTAPALNATTLVNGCYSRMFQGCTSLTTAPTLPATNLAEYCYQGMFNGCTALTTAPALPATTLADYCYGGHSGGMTTTFNGMFQGCTSLTTAPTLPATTLTLQCYDGMFYGCTNLGSITMLATDVSADSSLFRWVDGVAASGTFTKAASMTSLPSGVNGIPAGWTVVDAS